VGNEKNGKFNQKKFVNLATLGAIRLAIKRFLKKDKRRLDLKKLSLQGMRY